MKTVCLSRQFSRIKRLGYIDAFEFCKKLREHLLCVKIKEWRKGVLKDFESLSEPLLLLCLSRNYNLLIDKGPKNDTQNSLAD